MTSGDAAGYPRGYDFPSHPRQKEAAVRTADAEPGAYRLVYRVVSADGHAVSGQVGFTVSAGSSASEPSSSAGASGSSQDDVTIDLQLIPSEQYEQKVQTMIASGDGPDIMQVAEGVNVYSSKSQILPLDELISSAAQSPRTVNSAIRHAAGLGGVSVITLPGDVSDLKAV